MAYYFDEQIGYLENDQKGSHYIINYCNIFGKSSVLMDFSLKCHIIVSYADPSKIDGAYKNHLETWIL